MKEYYQMEIGLGYQKELQGILYHSGLHKKPLRKMFTSDNITVTYKVRTHMLSFGSAERSPKVIVSISAAKKADADNLAERIESALIKKTGIRTFKRG